ncbi:MAG: hypothetical protein V4510_00735 [bacterium]
MIAPDEADRIRKLHAAGYSKARIAKETGHDVKTITAVLARTTPAPVASPPRSTLANVARRVRLKATLDVLAEDLEDEEGAKAILRQEVHAVRAQAEQAAIDDLEAVTQDLAARARLLELPLEALTTLDAAGGVAAQLRIAETETGMSQDALRLLLTPEKAAQFLAYHKDEAQAARHLQTLTGKINALQSTIQSTAAQAATKQREVSDLEARLATLRRRAHAVGNRGSRAQEEHEVLKARRAQVQAELDEAEEALTSRQQEVAWATRQRDDLRSQRDALDGEVHHLQDLRDDLQRALDSAAAATSSRPSDVSQLQGADDRKESPQEQSGHREGHASDDAVASPSPAQSQSARMPPQVPEGSTPTVMTDMCLGPALDEGACDANDRAQEVAGCLPAPNVTETGSPCTPLSEALPETKADASMLLPEARTNPVAPEIAAQAPEPFWRDVWIHEKEGSTYIGCRTEDAQLILERLGPNEHVQWGWKELDRGSGVWSRHAVDGETLTLLAAMDTAGRIAKKASDNSDRRRDRLVDAFTTHVLPRLSGDMFPEKGPIERLKDKVKQKAEEVLQKLPPVPPPPAATAANAPKPGGLDLSPYYA